MLCRSGYSSRRSFSEGGLKKSECVSENVYFLTGV
jgi:hypothetical protein